MVTSRETPPASPSEREPPVVVTKTQARQGVAGHGVRYVLALGTLGVVVAFALIYFAFFG